MTAFVARAICIAALVAVGLCISAESFAHRVYPMIYELRPTGARATTTVRVENVQSGPISIELTAQSRSFDLDGVETNASAEDDFLIFPPQATVQPGRTQSFRVQYVGDPEIATSKSYLITVAQLPVQLRRDASGVDIAVNFATSAHVVPENARADIKVESVRRTSAGVEAIVSNAGGAYAALVFSKWTVTNAAGEKLVLDGEPLGAMLGNSLVLPGAKRRFVVKAPANIAAREPLRLTIELRPRPDL